MIAQLVGVLYTLIVVLKGPVVLGVLGVVAWSLMEAGGLLREWLGRRRTRARWGQAMDTYCAGEQHDRARLMKLLGSGPAPELVGPLPTGSPAPADGELSRLLQQAELGAARRLARLRIGLRLGPVLGLMGTLIPMGPALMSISRGDLASMSSDLVIAFGTTVAGLLAGALFYVMLIVRQLWYARDIADLEHLVDRTEGEGAA